MSQGSPEAMSCSNDKPLLKRCDLRECEARCCYDGAYLLPEDEAKMCAAVEADPTFFAFLPKPYIFTRKWKNHPPGRKTVIAFHRYINPDYPKHFARTRCSFTFDDGRCSLQVFAEANGLHPWTYKPTACWLHPLRIGPSGLIPPPLTREDDPARRDGYPGFITFTPCGEHRPDGKPWREVLHDEIEYFEHSSIGAIMSKRSYTCTWTDGVETHTETCTLAPSIDLPEVRCPDCGGAVEADPGGSMMWFTGRREAYATLTVRCPGCSREGFPSFYQGQEHEAEALKTAVANFMDRDSRPTIKLITPEEST